jgi:Holliday junction resolvase
MAMLSDEYKEKLIEEFKTTKLDLGQFCNNKKISATKFRKFGRELLGEDGWIMLVASKKKKQSQYVLGRQFEYRTRDIFANAGYFVFRSAQSRGVADIIAFKKGEVLFVQCKRSGGIEKAETLKLLKQCAEIGVTPLIAERPDGRTTQLYEVRLENGKIQKKSYPTPKKI